MRLLIIYFSYTPRCTTWHLLLYHQWYVYHSLKTSDLEASVTALSHLSTAWVWQGKRGKSIASVSPLHTNRSISPSDSDVITAGSVTLHNCQSMSSKIVLSFKVQRWDLKHSNSTFMRFVCSGFQYSPEFKFSYICVSSRRWSCWAGYSLDDYSIRFVESLNDRVNNSYYSSQLFW